MNSQIEERKQSMRDHFVPFMLNLFSWNLSVPSTFCFSNIDVSDEKTNCEYVNKKKFMSSFELKADVQEPHPLHA